MTARQRLTMAIALIPVATAVVMGAVVYLFMRFVPAYDLPGSSIVTSSSASVGNPTFEPLPGGAMQVTNSAVTIRGETDILSTILWISIISAVVLGLAGLLVGHLLAKRMLRPLHQFNEAATHAAEGGLDHRVGLTGPKDEFTDLSDTFDHMLERLDRTFQSHQRFTADASHELRTPLSAMKTMLEVAERDPDVDLPALLARLRLTNQRSIDTVEALLDLADLDHTTIERRPVRLDEVVDEVLASSATEIAANQLSVSVDVVEATVQGNAVLLRQLATNLVQNAIRHNSAGGSISVEMRSTADSVELAISNSGLPLDEASVATFTTPFSRGSGRTTTTGPRSSGLGLAVVAAITAAHDGVVTLSANPSPFGGLTAVVTLPRS